MLMHVTDVAQVCRVVSNASQEILLTLSRLHCASEKKVDLSDLPDLPDTTRVRTRVYVPSAESVKPELCERQLAALARGGVAVHLTRVHTPRMAIIDRSVVVLARNQVDYADGALIGQGLPFTGMLVAALAEVDAGGSSGGGEAQRLDSRSRGVLRQLTLGATDEKGARALGMTLRTYRRIVARLMDALDAESRFQAGYLAVKRNWL